MPCIVEPKLSSVIIVHLFSDAGSFLFFESKEKHAGYDELV
jgi:hypothetical protein